MPQPDPPVSRSGSTDGNKITCETLVTDSPPPNPQHPDPVPDPEPDPHPDYAPPSFFLSKDAELDWLDRNAFIERKDSGKGGAAPAASSSSHSVNLIPSSSQRYAANSKSRTASIFGLPKPAKTNYGDPDRRSQCRLKAMWLLPRRSESASGKSAVSVAEPGSPKVSCMGRVRSRREKGRSGANRTEPGLKKKKKKGTGFCFDFRSMCRSGVSEPEQEEKRGEVKEMAKGKKDKKEMKVEAEQLPAAAPRLGAAMMFSSGRRSDAWAGDLGA